jgi:hypothetical protein
VRPAHAAVLAHTAPPRAPHVKSCIPACRLRRDLSDTHVTGDVSGWSAMTKATWMCVPRTPLCSLTRRRRVHLTYVKSCIPACRLRRELMDTNVTGDVSGWSVMTEADTMCVPRAPLRSLARRRRVHLT